MTHKIMLTVPDELYSKIEKKAHGEYISIQEYILEKIRER